MSGQRRTVIVVILALAVAMGVSVNADTHGAQSTIGQTGSYTSPAANSVGSEGGNVTELNVSATVSTGNWQGFYGNVSGSLRLGDGSSVFYDWTDVAFAAVYASPDAAVDWASVSALSSNADKETKDSQYGFASAESDSINKTMTGSGCNAGNEIVGAAGVTPYNSTGQPGAWTTCLAQDGGATIIDTVLGTDVVSEGADAYDGSDVQYQLMVPVNATGQNYYFYLELQ